MDQTQDALHLRLLSIFHYVVGGFAGLFACFPIFHFAVGIGLAIFSLSDQSGAAFPGLLMGLFFATIAGSMMLFGWGVAICIILAGRFIQNRKRYTFCLAMAGIECTFTPFGTVLGVLTIITLVKPSVKELFDIKSTPQA